MTDRQTEKITVQAEALDRREGMTLDELGSFVQTAMRREVPGTARVRVRVGFRAQAQSVEVRTDG